jgi:predicted nucleotidyltransferase
MFLAICRKYGVVQLSLFGSVLRRDFDPHRSDIDVLVEFHPGAGKSLFRILEMQRELAELFGRNVELTTPGSLVRAARACSVRCAGFFRRKRRKNRYGYVTGALSKYFRDDVLATAQVLYDAA